ncbi:CRISPR-associated RAMP protein [Candidatus Bathyarchaeota archaeon]|nr:CRISPR-associated RAMP protein [Candidatus Bathyarchaeota archaeon]
MSIQNYLARYVSGLKKLNGGEMVVFEKLEKRLILSGTLEAVTPLHIGSGKTDIEIGEVDMPILRAPDGEPYVPGSSLKGKTRAEAERIAKARGHFICTPPNVQNMCGTLKRSPEEFCIVCKIFGTAGAISVSSKVRFRDAYPIKPVESLLERTGTAIDRSTGTVSRGALYTVEAIPAGTSFNLEVVAENLTAEELKLFKAALKSVEDSAVGGSSSRGFGKVKINFTKLIERTPRFYLGEEEQRIVEGENIKKWWSE